MMPTSKDKFIIELIDQVRTYKYAPNINGASIHIDRPNIEDHYIIITYQETGETNSEETQKRPRKQFNFFGIPSVES